LDEVAGLGTFVELETLVENDPDLTDAKQRLTSLAIQLGLTENELRSYSELMSQAKASRDTAT
jgi:predicted adenylyl cyclase CyaB